MMDKFLRRFYHLYRSGCLMIGVEHFLVMFPSALLIAKLTSTRYGAVVELSSVLFACGIGTICFSFLTKCIVTNYVPFFLGPSFCYIGFVSYQVARISNEGDIEGIRSVIFCGYLLAGGMLFVLCWLYRYEKIKSMINMLFPSTVMGPSISLVGLELASMAAEDSGFSGNDSSYKLLSLLTVLCIIVFSLLRHHFLQNASVLIGVIFGCVVAALMGKMTLPAIRNVVIRIPRFYFTALGMPPKKWLSLAFAVFPCSMIAFIESLGRLSVYQGMLKRDEILHKNTLSSRAILIHALTSIATSVTSMMPSAIYAENLAIMNLHSAELSTKKSITDDDDIFVNSCYSKYTVYPYIVASVLSICVAMFGELQNMFLAIPIPVLGGMELFVFGLITAPGIQVLVEQQVNYKKISNQIITSSVLLAGISNITITYETLTLKGMSLGLATGAVVNIITLILGRFGFLNEKYSVIEVMDDFINICSGNVSLTFFINSAIKYP